MRHMAISHTSDWPRSLGSCSKTETNLFACVALRIGGNWALTLAALKAYLLQVLTNQSQHVLHRNQELAHVLSSFTHIFQYAKL